MNRHQTITIIRNQTCVGVHVTGRPRNFAYAPVHIHGKMHFSLP